MASGNIRWIGLPKLYAKLDVQLNIGPETERVLQSVGGLARANLVGLMPGDWQRPRQVDLQVTQNAARMSMPRFPYVFFERGSAAAGSPGRSHRRKSERQFKSGGYRIRPRRYLRRTKGFAAKELRAHLLEMKRNTEQVWAS